MSDADALMWTVEKDPTLRSTVVTVLTLDRSPDWDGLEGGGAALVLKVHHSITDGVGGMKMLMMLFDLERDPGPPGPCDEFQDLPAFTPFDLVGRSLDYQGRRALDIARHGFGNAVGAARNAARDPEAALEEAGRVTRSLASVLAPATTPRSPIIGARSLGRRLTAP